MKYKGLKFNQKVKKTEEKLEEVVKPKRNIRTITDIKLLDDVVSVETVGYSQYDKFMFGELMVNDDAIGFGVVRNVGENNKIKIGDSIIFNNYAAKYCAIYGNNFGETNQVFIKLSDVYGIVHLDEK